MTKIIQKLDLTDKRKLFVVGDIHGCFSLLEQRLNEVGFQESTDVLISVGDLVDRGPESTRAQEFIEYPWFYPVKGNHEEMCLPETAGSAWHTQNGGAWFNELVDSFGPETGAKFGEILNNLPYAIEVKRGECKYGFVHASLYDVDDWNDVEQRIDEVRHRIENPFLWDRMHFYAARRLAVDDPNHETNHGKRFVVDNIDHVYFGHTPIKDPLTYGNCSWIDTGAFATNVLTVLEII